MEMCGRTSVERKRTVHIRKRTAGSDSSANKALGHSRLSEFHGRRRLVSCCFVIVAMFATELVAVPSADRAGSTLAVSVTVVRSCAVAVSPSSGESALVDLKCPSGATDGLRAAHAAAVQSASAGVRRLRLPTTDFRGSGDRPDVRVVTVDF